MDQLLILKHEFLELSESKTETCTTSSVKFDG